jgi:hypothetical protein
MGSMEKLVTGIGSALIVAAIFFGSMIMATLTQTFAENIFPDLEQKRDLLFWVWLFLWIALLTVLWTALKGFLNI